MSGSLFTRRRLFSWLAALVPAGVAARLGIGESVKPWRTVMDSSPRQHADPAWEELRSSPLTPEQTQTLKDVEEMKRVLEADRFYGPYTIQGLPEDLPLADGLQALPRVRYGPQLRKMSAL